MAVSGTVRRFDRDLLCPRDRLPHPHDRYRRLRVRPGAGDASRGSRWRAPGGLDPLYHGWGVAGRGGLHEHVLSPGRPRAAIACAQCETRRRRSRYGPRYCVGRRSLEDRGAVEVTLLVQPDTQLLVDRRRDLQNAVGHGAASAPPRASPRGVGLGCFRASHPPSQYIRSSKVGLHRDAVP